MYKRILVPVDGSAVSALGLLEAVRFAKDQRARLRIVHIVDESVLIQYPGVSRHHGTDARFVCP